MRRHRQCAFLISAGQMTETSVKRCFVICPIGEAGSIERAWSDDVFHNFVDPIAVEFSYKARRAIDDALPGEITGNMVADIVEADLVVADLTFHNANVFYELAVRHARGAAFLHIAKVGTKIPFDISTINTVFIDCSTFAGSDKSRADLRFHFQSIADGTASFDNPVKRYQQKLQTDQTGDPIQKRLMALETEVASLTRISAETRSPLRIIPLPRTVRDTFVRTNVQWERAIEVEMRERLLGNRFKLIFNPATGASKTITFFENGQIGEGRNANESGWRIMDGRLEILQADGAVHSRFIYVGNNNSFHHTGESDLKSIKGQSIILE